MNALFILNNIIKGKKNFHTVLSEIEHSKVFESCILEVTKKKEHAIAIARKGVKNFDLIVAVGGDGTLNEVLNGFIEGCNLYSPNKTPILAYLPMGTANDFSKTSGSTAVVSDFIALAKHRTCQNIDIGKITYTDIDGNPQIRYFINVADAGIGGEVVQHINNSKSKQYFGANITYLKSITQSFLTYKQSHVICEADNFTWEGPILTFAIANGRYFGSGMCISPNANITDGIFEIVIISDVNIMDYILNIRKLKKGVKIEHPKIHYFRAKKLHIKPEQYSCSIDADGEFIGNLPMTVEVVPNVVQFLMPRSSLLSNSSLDNS